MANMFPPSPQTRHTQDTSHVGEHSPVAAGSFSWWTWRPGIAPVYALVTGLPLILVASLLFGVGLYTLIFAIIDRASSSLPGSLFLLLLGSLLLPYALFLTFGGWHDLRGQKRTIIGRVIARRTTATNVIRHGRATRPGVTSGLARPWYGLALQSLDQPGSPLTHPPATQPQIMIFRLSEERYRELREGEMVQIAYTPHLHYVSSLKQVADSPG